MEKYNPEKLFGVTKMEKKIVVYRKTDDLKVICFDGEKESEITMEQLKSFQKNNYDCPNKYVKADNKLRKEGKFVDVTLQEYYQYFIEMAEDLKKATKGKINLYKTGELPLTAQYLFYKDYYEKIKKDDKYLPDEFSEEESEWVRESMQGPLINAEPYEGKGYKADFISMYPSIMASQHQLFPIKRGKFEILDSIDFKGFQGKAIYRCIIHKSCNKHIDKMFRFNGTDKYPEQDVIAAQKLGLKVELIQDGEPNRLHYDRNCCLTGSQIFGSFVKMMFELKQKKVKGAKNIINDLWGKLMVPRTIQKTLKHGEPYEIRDDKRYYSETIYEDRIVLTLVPKAGYYHSAFARICPFLTSRGRFKMMVTVKDHLDKIVWLHTDGFISTEKLALEYGSKLGELKYEGYCENCFVKNATHKTPDKEFKL